MNDARMSISFSPDTGELIVRVQEPPQEDGRPGKSITFAGASICPLGYAELVQAHPEKKLTISLDWDDAQLVDTNIEGLEKSISYSAKAGLESQFTSRAIGLVKSGWLPPTLAASNKTTILIDKNIVSQILGRFDSGKAVGTDPDFLDLFADRPVRINPVLSAMEGNTRAIPTPEQVREQLNEVVTKLQAALPSAKLVVGSGSLTGALGLIEETRAGMARKQQFLMRVAPSLAAPVSKKNMPARRDAVLAMADECGVLRGSLVVLAALSAIFVANGASPAKRLLKFKPGYREEDAYNGLADLRSLEMLIHLFGLFPNEPTMLCTADRDLALFWTGIRASDFGRNGAAATCKLAPIEELLPQPVNQWLDYLEQ
jgi:hypothetical protein